MRQAFRDYCFARGEDLKTFRDILGE